MSHDSVIVTTEYGPVRGAASAGYRTFFDIPYAEGPEGAARFAAPAPPTPWSEPRDATAFGPTAPQPSMDGAAGPLDVSPYFGPGWVRGDDYLTVNVWRPEAGNGLPVMVLIPGGGLIAGSAGASLYNGRTFARDGVVLVAVNHRLGIPGFLDLDGAPRNRGLLDVLGALRWVNRNIAAFGGDPDNVTLFGESAGAILVGAVVAEAGSEQLIRRAILQSGTADAAFTPEQAARVTSAAAMALGVEPTAAAFADIPDDRLVAAFPSLTEPDLATATHRDPTVGLNPIALVADVQPRQRIAEGAGAGIELLVGTNAEEGRFYLAPSGVIATTTETELADLAAAVHDDAQRLVAAYRAAHPGATPGDLRALILGDALFVHGSRELADAHAAAGAATFAYRFDAPSSALGGALGAAHVVELPFVFDDVDDERLGGERGLLGPEPADRALAASVHRAWVDFATHGDPGWPRYLPSGRRTMVFSSRSEVVADPRGSLLDLWRA